MSSLLDEAIVDAKALREAVLKNAEASLLETYAPRIEQAISRLLQEDGLPMDNPMGVTPQPDFMGTEDEDEGEETESTFKDGEEESLGDVDYAVETDLEDGPSEDSEHEFEISRGELQTMLESLTKEIKSLEDETLPEEQPPLDSDIPLDEEVYEFNDNVMDESHDEEVELTEENINDMVESLVVDIMPKKRGWAGLPSSEQEQNEELMAAAAQDDENKQKIKDLLKVGKDLSESNKKLQASNQELKKTIGALNENVVQVNLVNARLLYSNRVLESNSLNERQKHKIVEALSNAGSVNEAKVIFETLQSASGSTRKDGPQSLSEAVSKSSTILPRQKRQEENIPFTDRMKILAGIKKN